MGISFKKHGPKYSAQDQDRLRHKIVDGKIMQGLMEAWQGKRELTATQLAIGLKMLDKLVPNLQASQIEVTEQQPYAMIPATIDDADAWSAKFKPGNTAGATGLAKDKLTH